MKASHRIYASIIFGLASLIFFKVGEYAMSGVVAGVVLAVWVPDSK